MNIKSDSKCKFLPKQYLISIISSIVSVILLILSVISFGGNIAINREVVSDEENFKATFQTNFIVYGLSFEQQDEYRNLDVVDYIYSYYLYEDTNFTIGGTGYKNNIAFYKENDVSGTPFDEKRLISKTTVDSNPIYVDYSFAMKYGLSLKDSFKVKLGKTNVDMTISGIYKTNYLEDTHVFIYRDDFKETIDSLFEGFKTNYSYIYASNTETFDAYMKKNYVPKAFMLNRSDFDSDIDYQIYLQNYYSKIFYNSTNVKSVSIEVENARVDNAKKNTLFSLLMSCFGVLLTGLLMAIVYQRSLKLLKYSTNDYKKCSIPLIAGSIVSFVLGLISFVILSSMFYSNLVQITFLMTIKNLTVILIGFIAAILAGLGINLLFTHRTLSSGKVENKKAA